MDGAAWAELYTAPGDVGSSEGNDSACVMLHDGSKVLLGLCMGVSACGLVANALILRFMLFQARRSPFATYTLSLAVADLSLLLLFVLLTPFIFSFAFCSFISSVVLSYPKLELAVGLLGQFFELSSLGLLAAISLERCLSVLLPTWYHRRRPKHLASVVTALLWALSGAFVTSTALSVLLGQQHEAVFGPMAVAISVVLSSVMLVANLSLSIALRCGSQHRRRGKPHASILLSITSFFILGVSFGLEVFLSLQELLTPLSQELLPTDASLLLAMLNSIMDLVVNFLVGGCRCRAPRSLEAALCCVFEEKAPSEEENPAAQGMALQDTA